MACTMLAKAKYDTLDTQIEYYAEQHKDKEGRQLFLTVSHSADVELDEGGK